MRWYHYMAYFFGAHSWRIQCPILSMESRAMPFKVLLHHRPAKACPPQRSTSSGAYSTLPSHICSSVASAASTCAKPRTCSHSEPASCSCR